MSGTEEDNGLTAWEESLEGKPRGGSQPFVEDAWRELSRPPDSFGIAVLCSVVSGTVGALFFAGLADLLPQGLMIVLLVGFLSFPILTLALLVATPLGTIAAILCLARPSFSPSRYRYFAAAALVGCLIGWAAIGTVVIVILRDHPWA